MNELIRVENNEVFTTSKIVADALSGNKRSHQSVMTTIKKILSYDGEYSRSLSGVTVKYIGTDGSNIVFEESTHKTSQGNIYPIFNMNAEAFHVLVMHLGRYKNARIVQRKFTTAFSLMRKLLKEKDQIIEDIIVDGTLPPDKKGTISTANKKERLKLVKAYYRSIYGKEETELDKAVREKQLNLFEFYQINLKDN